MSNKQQEEINRRTTDVAKASQDYKRIMHLLTISIPALGVTLKDLTIRQLSLQTIQFQKNSKVRLLYELCFGQGKLVLQSWVNAESMGEENPIEDVLVRGIDIRDHIDFTIGSIYEQILQSEKKEYQFFLCKVAVGRSMVVPDKGYKIQEPQLTSQDFDSAYIQNNYEIYRHEYRIFDKTRVLATHLVQFKIVPEHQAFLANLQQNCDNNCGQQATVYCKNDECYYCDNCNEQAHQSSPLFQKHVRVKIAEKPRNFGNCQDHPEREYQFFCMNCNQPICVYCKIDGSHAGGQQAKHGITRIGQAYKNAKDDTKTMDPALERKKKQITTQREQIRKKLQSLGDNVNNIEEKIYTMLKQALINLRQEYTRKVNVLQSDLVELNRQEAEIIYSHKILQKHSDCMGPIDFLNLWTGHTNFKNQLIEQSTKIHQIHTDIRVQNKPHIVSDNTFRPIELGSGYNQKLLHSGDPEFFKNYGAAAPNRNPALASSSPNQRVGAGFALSSQINPGMMNSSMGTSYVGRNPGLSQQQLLQNSAANGDIKRKKTQESIRGLIDLIENKMKEGQDGLKDKNSITSQAIRTSLYGVFCKTYKMLQEKKGPSNLRSALRSAFVGSEILDQTMRVVLYCNLPIDENYTPKTNSIYPNVSHEAYSIKNLLESMQKVANAKKNPCVLVMKVGNQILGAYCNEGWSFQQKFRGNWDCFLFNLTHNLRFNAVRGHSHYQETNRIEIEDKKDNYEIRFGTTDLVISNDFATCSSEIKDHFAFGNEFTKNRVWHINLKKQIFKPDKVEVWSLV